MQMQLLLETPESPFQLLSAVFGEPKFFSNFVLLQQMYLHRKRFFIRFSSYLVGCFYEKIGFIFPLFSFSLC